MFIGGCHIAGKVALAPMAGAADRAFREMCAAHGAAYVTGEMVSAKGLLHRDGKSRELLTLGRDERPAAVQLFGADPDTLARAASLAMEASPDVIDINMGCPAPKVTSSGAGSALLRNPDLCGRLIEAVRRETGVPVTAKLRTGTDAAHITVLEVALACEAGGAAALTVHGRTARQGYAPPADWESIAQVKRAVRIPVIGNGDVTDAKSAAALLEQTGCDMIAVGRAALGSPWIFTQINAYLKDGTRLPDPPVSRRMVLLYRQICRAAEYKGEAAAVREGRKHAAWAVKGLPGAAALRSEAVTVSSLSDLERFCAKAVCLDQKVRAGRQAKESRLV